MAHGGNRIDGLAPTPSSAAAEVMVKSIHATRTAQPPYSIFELAKVSLATSFVVSSVLCMCLQVPTNASFSPGCKDADQLKLAATSGDLAFVSSYLAGCDDIRAPVVEITLLTSTLHGHTDIVGLLLEAGANKHAVDSDSYTVLMMASLGNYADLVELFVQEGVNIEATNGYGNTALLCAAEATGERNDGSAVRVLAEAGADIEAANEFNGETALMKACNNGNALVVNILLQAGADTEAENGIGETALTCSLTTPNISVVKLLLQAGANVNASSHTRQTALTKAVENGFDDIVELLVEAGANT
jgi:hypothetical protein